MGQYEERVKHHTAEQILQEAGGGASGAVDSAVGEYLRVAAQVRSTQELITELKNASESNSKFSRRVVWLTCFLVITGLLQVAAIALPYLVKQKSEGANQQQTQTPAVSLSEPRKTNNWDRMRQCTAQADQFTAAAGLVEGQQNGGTVTTGWTNHYSPKYEHCYLLVSYVHKGGKAKPPGEPISHNELWDVFERKLLSTCAGAQFGTNAYCSIDGQKGFDCAACQEFIDDRMK